VPARGHLASDNAIAAISQDLGVGSARGQTGGTQLGDRVVALIPALRRVRLPRRRFPTAAPAIGAPQQPVAVPPSPLASEPAPAPRLRDWIGVLAMVTGLVMAIMDVQIVTSSLTQIQGGLSASADEIAWVASLGQAPCALLRPASAR
jgi:hypothetical protein